MHTDVYCMQMSDYLDYCQKIYEGSVLYSPIENDPDISSEFIYESELESPGTKILGDGVRLP